MNQITIFDLIEENEPLKAFEIYKEEFNLSPEIVESFKDYLDMRKKNGYKLNANKVKKAIMTLQRLSSDPGEQLEIINQSIIGCWDGLFPLKKAAPIFPESDFSEIVEYINEELGIKFIKKSGELEKLTDDDPEPDNYYEYKKKGLRLELGKGKFFPEIYGGAYYISVGWDISTGGGCSPVDTIEEAIRYFQLVLSKYS